MGCIAFSRRFASAQRHEHSAAPPVPRFWQRGGFCRAARGAEAPSEEAGGVGCYVELGRGDSPRNAALLRCLWTLREALWMDPNADEERKTAREFWFE